MAESTLSDRGQAIAKTSLKSFLAPILSNPYDPNSNPQGFVDMGTAENHVMTKHVSEFANRKINTIPRTFTYGEGPWGSKRLRAAMARHMNKYFHPVRQVEPDDLIFTNGITTLCELFGYAVAEAGDGILMPRPIYQAFETDFGAKAKMKCVFVAFGGVDQFSLDAVEIYERALLKSEAEGIKIRALMLCNPHNPLGQCYPVDTIIALMQLCQKYKIHMYSDEVYALSVYDIQDPHVVPFQSVLSFDSSAYIDPNYLHLVYGFSKDFAAGGLRLGCIYSRNPALMDAVGAITQFAWSGSLNQLLAAEMLEDEEWLDAFFKQSQKSLAEKNMLCRRILDEHGIEYSKGSNAGFFIWANLRPYFTYTGETDDWAAEKALEKRMAEKKIYITAGSMLQSEQAGWFRIIYSQEEEVLQEGFKRLFEAIGPRKQSSFVDPSLLGTAS